MEYENDQQGYEDSRPYDRERSRSPRDDYRGNGDARDRSASPIDRDRGGDGRPAPPIAPPEEDEEEARNQGSNLFVTGIHPRLSEDDIIKLFQQFGTVEKCNIMRDPHSRESRGFGFVNMGNVEQADAAKEKLQGEQIEGRTLSIEKARRSKPRTPTPGKYFGPPKHDFRGPPRGGGRYGDRYDDRRGYGGRRGGGDDYSYRSSRYGGGGSGGGGGRYGDRYEDRGYHGDRGYGGYGGRRDRYDDRAPQDRYGRDDRYERRGGGGGGGGGSSSNGRYYDDRDSRRAPLGDPYPPADSGAGKDYGGRSYDDAPPAARYDRR